mgnify:FL=1
MQARGRGGGLTQDPPALPRDKVALLQLMLQEHDRLSGNVEALQGRTPGAQTSGRLMQQLRQEARGPLGFKATFIEHTALRLLRLGLDACVKWLEPRIWYEILNSYPPFVVDEFRRRLEPERQNVKLSASMGRGILEQVEKEEAQALWTAQLIDKRTALEKHRLDPDPIIRRQRQDIEEQLQVQGMAALQAASVGAAPGNGSGAQGGAPIAGAASQQPVNPAQPASPAAPSVSQQSGQQQNLG